MRRYKKGKILDFHNAKYLDPCEDFGKFVKKIKKIEKKEGNKSGDVFDKRKQ